MAQMAIWCAVRAISSPYCCNKYGPDHEQEALILARDVNSDTPQAARTRRGARWGAVHVTALYAEEAHIKTGALRRFWFLSTSSSHRLGVRGYHSCL